jgi:SAM-dependent methyltransferase
MMRERLKIIVFLKLLVVTWRVLRNKYSLMQKITELAGFFSDYRKYRSIEHNKNFLLRTADLYPRLFDKTATTGIDPVYFYQDTWCARKIFENKPVRHYDVGSKADLVGTISQFTPTTMVDIRPLTVSLPELSFIEGSILALPFKDGEISSLSSICVIEHIGLGRYGDPLDPFGSEKSAKELSRVLAPGGSLYLSVPIDKNNTVYFNAHRAFTREYIIGLFGSLQKIEEKYIYGSTLYDSYDPTRGFGTGLFWFKK